MTTETIGSWIYSTLTGNTTVANLVGTKIWPFVTPGQQDVPWIVYDDILVNYERTKDHNYPVSATVTITCAHDSFADSVALADAVVEAINDVDNAYVETVSAFLDSTVGILHEITLNIEL